MDFSPSVLYNSGMSEPKSGFRAAIETLGSVKLGVGLMIALAAASVIGTVVLQTSLSGADPSEVRAHYGAFAGPFILLGLTDVFHSTWYAVLLAILALNVACATAARFALRLDKVGMLLAHAGILVVLAGGLVYSLRGDKGFVVLKAGGATNHYASRTSGEGLGRLPFTLRLDGFDAVRYPARMILLGPKGERFAVTPRKGDEVALPWTSAKVLFEKVLPRAGRVASVLNDDNAPVHPAAHLRLETPGGAKDLWRFAVRSSPADTLLTGDGRVAVAFDNALTAKGNDLPAEPRAYAVNRETGRTVEIPCKAGQTFPLPNAGVPGAWGQVVSIDDDADNTSRGPILFLRLHADNAISRRLAVARLPGFSPEAAWGMPVGLPEIDFIYYRPTLVISVVENGWKKGAGVPRFAVRTLEGATWSDLGAVELGKSVLCGGDSLTILDFRPRARVDVSYEPLAERNPADDWAQEGVEAVKVRVTWPAGPPREYWLAAAGPDQALRAGQALALIYSPSEGVREYRADVRLDTSVAPGEPAVIRVNHPAGMLGWQVYLQDIDYDAVPHRATLMVSRDPGLPLVYAGFALLALGAFVAGFKRKEGARESADCADDAD